MNKGKIKRCINFLKTQNQFNIESLSDVRAGACCYEDDDSPTNLKDREDEIEAISYTIDTLEELL